MKFWKSPDTKDAYRLSWVSLACTLVAAMAGLVLYSVRCFRLSCWCGFAVFCCFLSVEIRRPLWSLTESILP